MAKPQRKPREKNVFSVEGGRARKAKKQMIQKSKGKYQKAKQDKDISRLNDCLDTVWNHIRKPPTKKVQDKESFSVPQKPSGAVNIEDAISSLKNL